MSFQCCSRLVHSVEIKKAPCVLNWPSAALSPCLIDGDTPGLSSPPPTHDQVLIFIIGRLHLVALIPHFSCCTPTIRIWVLTLTCALTAEDKSDWSGACRASVPRKTERETQKLCWCGVLNMAKGKDWVYEVDEAEKRRFNTWTDKMRHLQVKQW